MNLEEFGKKALELACHYQNRCCEQEEIIEMFCLDAAAAQAITQRLLLTDAQIEAGAIISRILED